MILKKFFKMVEQNQRKFLNICMVELNQESMEFASKDDF